MPALGWGPGGAVDPRILLVDREKETETPDTSQSGFTIKLENIFIRTSGKHFLMLAKTSSFWGWCGGLQFFITIFT